MSRAVADTTDSAVPVDPPAVRPPAASAVPTATTDKASTKAGNRFAFLDALRGIAAMAVVMQHAAESIWPAYLRFSVEVIRPGEYGVFLFFIVSGFIIPASLEKYGSLVKFWLGRLFRLFPLYWFCIVAALALHYVFDRFYLPESWDHAPRRYAVLNLTMVQRFLDGTPLVIGATWSLAYEMVFYLAMSLLFIAGWHRRSVPLAVTTMCLAGGVGLLLPAALVTGDLGGRGKVAAACLTLLVAVVVASRARSRGHRLTAVGLAAVTVPLALNQPEQVWFALVLFGTMFTGTVMYRMMTGEVRPRVAWSTFGLSLALVLVVLRVGVVPHVEPISGATLTYRAEFLTFAAAYGTFALGLLLRGRVRWPRFLTYLGLISYSLYLVHTLVLYAVPWWPESVGDRVGIANGTLTWVTWVGVTVLVSAATYRFVEKPFQDLGHRLTRRPAASGSVSTAPSPSAR